MCGCGVCVCEEGGYVCVCPSDERTARCGSGGVKACTCVRARARARKRAARADEMCICPRVREKTTRR